MTRKTSVSWEENDQLLTIKDITAKSLMYELLSLDSTAWENQVGPLCVKQAKRFAILLNKNPCRFVGNFKELKRRRGKT